MRVLFNRLYYIIKNYSTLNHTKYTEKHNQKYKFAVVYKQGIMAGLASLTLAP